MAEPRKRGGKNSCVAVEGALSSPDVMQVDVSSLHCSLGPLKPERRSQPPGRTRTSQTTRRNVTLRSRPSHDGALASARRSTTSSASTVTQRDGSAPHVITLYAWPPQNARFAWVHCRHKRVHPAGQGKHRCVRFDA